MNIVTKEDEDADKCIITIRVQPIVTGNAKRIDVMQAEIAQKGLTNLVIQKKMVSAFDCNRQELNVHMAIQRFPMYQQTSELHQKQNLLLQYPKLLLQAT